MSALARNFLIPALPPTLGGRLMAALDVASVSTPAQVPAARAVARGFASEYGFSMPPPARGAESPDAFMRIEASAFVRSMRPVFDAEVGRIARSACVFRSYINEDLVHADVASASSGGLLCPQVASSLLRGAVESAERILEFSSQRVPLNRYSRPSFVGIRVAADISVLGAAFAFTGSPLAATIAAGLFALKVEFASIALSRLLARREMGRIDARVAELFLAIDRAAEQGASLAETGLVVGEPAGPIELDEGDLIPAES